MLRLWSRAAEVQSTCRCVSCLSTTSGGLASRTASAASKRRLRIGNSVTALYTSIFAAAALADAQAKDQRRLEWKEKIAAVREEVNELVDEEQRLLAALASRQKPQTFNGMFFMRQYRPSQMTTELPPRHPAQLSLRSYHSQAAAKNSRSNHNEKFEAVAGWNQDMIGEGMDFPLEESVDTHIGSNVQESAQNDLDNDAPDTTDLYLGVSRDMESDMASSEDKERSFLMPDERGFIYKNTTIPRWLARDGVRMNAIRTIALKQLAIRFLLRPTIAHDYLGLRARYDQDKAQPRLRSQQLLSELNKLRRRMMLLKTNRKHDISDLVPDVDSKDPLAAERRNSDVDQQVRSDIEEYLCGNASLDELLIKLAHSLANATDPNRMQAFKYMLLAFTRTRQTDLGDLVLKAILPNMFPLNATLILTILNFLYKSKNLKSFDMFLEMIRGDGFPVDMKQLGYYKREVINGVEITVPPLSSANAVAYSTLIIASLRFDQPDRADAYLQHARSVGYMDSFPTLNAYLKFYTIRGDWEKGLHTMKRALAFISSSTEHKEYQVERLISLMVRFCDSCQRYDISEALIAGAVHSGFDWESAAKQNDLEFPADADYERWEKARDSASRKAVENRTWEKSYAFVNTVSEHLNNLPLPEAESARRWQKLMGTYAQQVLSAVVSGAPTQYQESKLIAERGNQPTSQSPETNASPSSYPDNIAQAHQQEISSLKDEVSQLKRMVFELTQTKSTAAPEQTPQTDLGQLKTHLSSTKTVPPEKAAQITIQYGKS